MAGTNYSVNYDDERFAEVEEQKQQALTQNEQLYGGMVDQSGKFYQDQIDAQKQWAEEQKNLQQEQTDFTIEQIEQQKEKAEKDYKKEQQGAYVDYQKQNNQYGANAEQMAANGLVNTGYSESTKASYYNTYQNRVAVARESYQNAVLNYDNNIKEAQLQNNSALAEIAFQTLQKELELALQGFQYENTLLMEQANKKLEIDSMYYGRYQDVLAQINQENALAEQVRQYNEQMAYQKAQDEKNYQLQLKQLQEEQRQYNASLAEDKRQFNASLAASKTSQKTYALTTDYYQGDYNSDIRTYGAFSNGYQPKGISGYGEVKKSGDTVELTTQTLAGKTVKLTQNVWVTSDGTEWYWEGRENKYKKLQNSKKTGSSKLK